MLEEASSNWAKEDAQVWSWLSNSIEPNIACDVMILPGAFDVWQSLQETLTLYEIHEEILFTEQGTKILNERYNIMKAKQ